MEEATDDLILALQLEDLEGLKRDFERLEDADTTPDTMAVLDIYREELKATAATLTNLRYGQKLREAETDSRPPSPVPSATPMFDDLLSKSLAQITVEDNVPSETESSSLYQDAGTQICAACFDERPHWQSIEAPCGGNYCAPCIVELFGLAMNDESLFPPRCCKQPITLDTVGSALSAAQRKQFEDKSIEFGTTDRTYCHEVTCTAFIPPTAIDGEKAVCQVCERLTCAVCKGTAHEGDCPEDPGYIALMEAAAAAGYQSCYQCKRLVELNIGCNHMTCLCRTEFCYVCGARWKECACPQWDEERLLARAQQLVARAPGPAQAGTVPNAVRIRQAAEQLRERHECGHDGRWQKIATGDLQCEECFQILPEFILQCPQCHLRACVRCKMNRL